MSTKIIVTLTAPQLSVLKLAASYLLELPEGEISTTHLDTLYRAREVLRSATEDHETTTH